MWASICRIASRNLIFGVKSKGKTEDVATRRLGPSALRDFAHKCQKIVHVRDGSPCHRNLSRLFRSVVIIH
ncbi:hypothetical protein SERLADRAFT_369191 [Serpula lacrymans var. lacrymans S7.9]|uniref:Uncharacterized protein n=1 Tax=Serpula lacrymans var. lacrymans (strain S7.9) TaxID=578457 RepID=F8NU55_SERL9|nr:uncharacterized protein SERLADRAFT_369191 [Serpula lacrymans var. lacrymans S7.9]EGO25821.1 hypothetical protein SERLADRAFT_369191 [Serpula lacrymans var. lacrymans S7.9]